MPLPREEVKADGSSEPRSRKVIGCQDVLRGRLRSFSAKVEAAKAVIGQAAQLGRVGVSFSGGKDSTVLLHLVRSVVPEAPAGFFDDGAQLADTYEFIRATPNVQIITVKPSLIEMCKAGGYWGYQSATPDVTFNFMRELILKPARQFVDDNGLAVSALGLRGDESSKRHLNALIRGQLYWHRGNRVYHLCPLTYWSVDDIWAYIASYAVPYNRVYDRMASLGLERDEMRVAPVLGATAVGWGRYVYLKQLDPELWNTLANDFPKLRVYV